MENKNLLIALVLMLAVWIGFTLLFPPQTPPPQRQAPVAAPEEGGQERLEDTGQAEAQSSSPEESAVAEKPVEKPAVPVVEESEVRDLVVENQVFRAVFTNRGGRLKSLELKKFRQTSGKDAPPVELVRGGAGGGASLALVGEEGFGLSAGTLFAVSTDRAKVVVPEGEAREIVFTALTNSGVVVERVFTIRGNDYLIDHSVRVRNQGSRSAGGALQLALVQGWDEEMAGSRFEFVGPVTLVGDEVHTDDVDDVQEAPLTYRDAVWTGFETKYFIGAAIPLQGSGERVTVRFREGNVENLLHSKGFNLGPGQQTEFQYLLYFGPRDSDYLEAVDHRLGEAIDYGFFSVIARPLLKVLKFFYSFVGNYGVAIIILTVIIKLIFWPLTQKSYTSMKAMQKLQPEMQKIREKFKNDRERLNKEIMELYKTHRVNPLGGCLPMVIQIPVFIALYHVLLGSIELRHAPFALWITDLSAKDPYYITPLIMGASMVVQQKLTPSQMDPTQAKLFMIMPVVFTFIFLNFPAGLVIYWLTNNLLTIFQQLLIHRRAEA